MRTRLKRWWQRVLIRVRPRVVLAHLRSHHPQFRMLLVPGAKIERVATGFQFTEGPVWVEAEGALLFSDIPASRIYRLSQSGKVSVFREPSNQANGLACDQQGRLIACEHGTRRVTRTEADGAITVLAEQFQGKRLNSPNDVIVAKDGSVYFTDPPYGIKPQEQEQPMQGVYRIAPDGELTCLINDFDCPNGLVFSPDQSRLYIADSSLIRHVRVFDVHADGSLAGGEVFCNMAKEPPGVPDGMCCDRNGNLFCTGPGGVWVIDPTGVHLGTIVLPEPPANCTWGGSDLSHLYITACQSVYRLQLIAQNL
jgi:gluconolactonase